MRTTPITGMGCCAGAITGQVTAAAPSAAINSRRPIVAGICLSPEGCLPMETIPLREHTVFEVRPGVVLQGRSNVS
jgi:hypothetical protein